MADFAARYNRPLHPLSALMLAFAFPLFLGGLLSDWAYHSTFEIQWKNFASWLIAGALVGTGLAIAAAIFSLFSATPDDRGRRGLYLLLLFATFVIGFVNALVHAKDGWAAMPTGLLLSILTAILALVTSWIGFSGFVGKVLK